MPIGWTRPLASARPCSVASSEYMLTGSMSHLRAMAVSKRGSLLKSMTALAKPNSWPISSERLPYRPRLPFALRSAPEIPTNVRNAGLKTTPRFLATVATSMLGASSFTM